MDRDGGVAVAVAAVRLHLVYSVAAVATAIVTHDVITTPVMIRRRRTRGVVT